MPAYELRIDPPARRDLERLSPTLLDRIDERIKALAVDPRPAGSQKLTGRNAHRSRLGDYRIVYEIDDSARTVTVTRVRHRREVYRKLR